MEPENEMKTAVAVEVATTPEDDTITLSTGVVLRGKQAPPLVLVKVMAAFPRPKPPTWKDPKMGREMENPDDPEYLDRVKAWQIESSNATLNALVLLGTELVSKPKKMPGPMDDTWLEDYELLGVPMNPGNKNWRYLTWMTFKAALTTEDLDKIKEVVGRLSGVPEKAVAAAETFPGSDKA
jgi:hypothetical protein